MAFFSLFWEEVKTVEKCLKILFVFSLALLANVLTLPVNLEIDL